MGHHLVELALKYETSVQVPVWFLSLLQDEETAVVGALLQWLTWDEDNGDQIQGMNGVYYMYNTWWYMI